MSSEYTSESLIRNISFVLYAKTTAGIPQGATLLPMLFSVVIYVCFVDCYRGKGWQTNIGVIQTSNSSKTEVLTGFLTSFDMKHFEYRSTDELSKMYSMTARKF